jgi:hypothetical protein
MRPAGKVKPEFTSAARTRSLLSLMTVAGSPTIQKVGALYVKDFTRCRDLRGIGQSMQRCSDYWTACVRRARSRNAAT